MKNKMPSQNWMKKYALQGYFHIYYKICGMSLQPRSLDLRPNGLWFCNSNPLPQTHFHSKKFSLENPFSFVNVQASRCTMHIATNLQSCVHSLMHIESFFRIVAFKLNLFLLACTWDRKVAAQHDSNFKNV
jgi:hypothetical protein